jgi:hypothetical protein
MEDESALLRRRDDGVVWRELDGEIVLLDLRSSMYFTLNSTGKLLWDLLAQPSTTQVLVASIIDAYGVSDAQAASDVEAFVVALAEHDLVQAGAGGP